MQKWGLSYFLHMERNEKVRFENEIKKAMIFAVDERRYRQIFRSEIEEEQEDLNTDDFKELNRIIDELSKQKSVSMVEISKDKKPLSNNDIPWT